MSITRTDAAPAEDSRGEWRTYGGRGEIVSRVDGWTPRGKMSDVKRARLIREHDAAGRRVVTNRSAYCRDCGAALRAWEGHGESGEFGMCHDCA